MSAPAVKAGALRRLDERRPIVAIIGRPNVGKSTLFNRLVQARRAITDDRPGVTRDRLYAEVWWDGRRLTLMDTGGYLPGTHDALTDAVALQAEAAVMEADLVLLVCDATVPPTDLDRRLAAFVLRSGKPYLLAANKLDTAERESATAELHGLGLGPPQPISAATGRRSGDLLAAIVARLGVGQAADESAGEGPVRVVLAGRPNVGKSTLMNRLAGAQVSLVDAEPGTTRDTTTVRLLLGGRSILLIDTAGLRRRSRVEDAVEYYSSRRAADAIARADVVLALLDATESGTAQDARIIAQAIEAGCGLVIAVNKWDLVGPEADRQRHADELRARFPFVADYPIVPISAATGSGVQRCLGWLERVACNRQQRIPTHRLNEFLEETLRHSAPGGGGHAVRVLYVTQTASAPPTFIFFATRPDLVDGAYRRYVEKRLREAFDFAGTPVRTTWRGRRPR